jgi:hypothetical protein
MSKRVSDITQTNNNKLAKMEPLDDDIDEQEVQLDDDEEEDEEDEEIEGVITIEGIELEASVDRVKDCLKQNPIEVEDIDDYDFYLQENRLDSERSIIEQCNLVEGAKQQTKLINIKLVFDTELKRVNILDILKPPENVVKGLPNSNANNNTNNNTSQSQTHQIQHQKQLLQPKRLIGGIKTIQNDGHCLPSPGNRTGNNGQIQLWQFLLELLTDADHRECIQWIGSEG